MQTELSQILKTNKLHITDELQGLYSTMLEAKIKFELAQKNFQDAVEDAKLDSPISDRLVYSAFERCCCGAGLAYDTSGDSGKPYGGYWDCSDILLETADKTATHTGKLFFRFYNIKCEEQPSAAGATTRQRLET